MILSSAYQTPAGALLAGASLLSISAYGWVAAASGRGQETPARPQGALLLAWAVHLLALILDIAGLGQAVPGARFGFAPALSMTVWLVIAVYMLESRFLPLASVRRILALMAATVVLLAFVFPGESRPQAASPWAPIHWVLGLASYGLFGVAVLHAALLSRAERQMRQMKPGIGKPQEPRPEPLMPLLRLERLTFQFVGAGVAVLSLAVLLGWWFTPHWRWDHKNLFAVLGWLVLSGLLAGRRVFGWRGRRATRWLYFGALMLLLSYAGSRFVLEVVLQRTV
ncbi:MULTISPECIES: cytochrome C assembly family protein [Roseateles]|uniref:Cytochrome c biogenesis protein CcsA n=1 Tax=Roseateles albus TaxID=2987525 RepID=A0ABT5KIW9_9BURK|nr:MULTISPECIES: cytochrome c biogenesis protein CcsA [Roseateles]MCV2361396.1 cytochrome c biogenesis protein CcsA [Paucibacter sp. TC2R-5]MDC8773870.1 cytochrome c biogenesis protein CcsA [Roseateles albus]